MNKWYTMEKDLLKAIRRVNGWNPDLRVNLRKGIARIEQYTQQIHLEQWIFENRAGLFPLEIMVQIKSANSPYVETLTLSVLDGKCGCCLNREVSNATERI